MTQKEFMQGWALLVAQPYGVGYRREPEAERSQRAFWQEQFGSVERAVWVQVIRWWIEHEDHFPLVPEMRAYTRRFTSPPDPKRDQVRLVHGQAIPVDQADILAFALAHDVTVFEAVRRWKDVEAWRETPLTAKDRRTP